METKIQRTDDKIRQRFVIRGRGLPGATGVSTENRLAAGHIYEQRNVMLTKREGQHVSEQFSSLDAVLQSMSGIYQIEFLET